MTYLYLEDVLLAPLSMRERISMLIWSQNSLHHAVDKDLVAGDLGVSVHRRFFPLNGDVFEVTCSENGKKVRR